ncbi:hypothetical protein [Streptomyces sp. NBC_00059]|nr:hypothetical protein [Streptomyces sp. NBC_00059]MCX5417640.1 hypothetical protein [Streptomyces sp. NBC_00059]
MDRRMAEIAATRDALDALANAPP